MNKVTQKILIIFAIVVVVISTFLFLLVDEKTAQFWVSYAAGILALGSAAYGAWRNLNNLDKPSSHPFLQMSACYFGVVVLMIVLGYGVWTMPTVPYVLCHVLWFAIYLIAMVIASAGHGYVTGQEKEARRQVIKARMDAERVVQLGAAADDLPDDIRADAKSVLLEVEEKLRYSDPMQSEETAQQANDVEVALDVLEETMDALLAGQSDLTTLQLKAKAAIRKIDAYNRAKKMMK